MTEKTLKGKRVLLIEDSSDAILLMRARLEKKAGCTLVAAETGNRAIELFESAKYDIVLLDYHLPDMTGPDVAQALRRRGCRTPILGLTAYDAAQVERACFAAGMNAVLCKITPGEEFEAKLLQLLA